MASGHTGSEFRTTSWTLIARAIDSGAELEALLSRYWSPVYAYLRRTGRESHEAEDLTQAFLTEIVLGRELIERADKARGRFRSFLRRALENFLVDEYRREHGRDGSRAAMFMPADRQLIASAEPSARDDPVRAFDRQWATAMLGEALGRTENVCRNDGMERQWTAFEERILTPALHGNEPTQVDDLVARFNAKSRQEVYSMIQTIKRKINSALRELVAETVEDAHQVDIELEDLRQYLSLAD